MAKKKHTRDAIRRMSRGGAKGGKVGGASNSPAKQAAARENGKRGGRPRKVVTSAR